MQQKRKIVPPVYLVLTMGAVYAADRWLPIVQWVPDPVSRSVTLLFLALGLLLIGHSAWSFSKVDTGIVPFDPATSLVTGGFYRFTRNPMYLGMLLILLGMAFKMGSLGGFLPVPLFVWIINRNFIRGEEEFLEEAFGD
ncbi:MAG: isoprenylcysteine carboxylmethyltransferase family protein, partial [Gammaproteobacteria bacterium]|nr:isoprenylcysteine carboxylmethyltransferase family protein [Gammaproteobacteria bacterium]